MYDLFTMLLRYAIIAYGTQIGLEGGTIEALVGFGSTGLAILWSLHTNGYLERFRAWLGSWG